jgi:hypothetical protein
MPVLDQLCLDGRVALVARSRDALEAVTGEVVFVDGGLSAG